jgi:adenylate cyclase
VNLASRLEGINKQYKTKILISEATWNQLPKNLFLTREIDSITVKGKEIPVRIFELVDIRNSETEKL